MIKLVLTFKETEVDQVKMKDQIKTYKNVTAAEMKSAGIIQKLVHEYLKTISQKMETKETKEE